jgi:hypothetical protein
MQYSAPEPVIETVGLRPASSMRIASAVAP